MKDRFILFFLVTSALSQPVAAVRGTTLFLDKFQFSTLAKKSFSSLANQHRETIRFFEKNRDKMIAQNKSLLNKPLPEKRIEVAKTQADVFRLLKQSFGGYDGPPRILDWQKLKSKGSLDLKTLVLRFEEYMFPDQSAVWATLGRCDYRLGVTKSSQPLHNIHKIIKSIDFAVISGGKRNIPAKIAAYVPGDTLFKSHNFAYVTEVDLKVYRTGGLIEDLQEPDDEAWEQQRVIELINHFNVYIQKLHDDQHFELHSTHDNPGDQASS